MVVEKVFINGGEIYKISPPPNGQKDARKEGFFLASQYVGGNTIQANYLNYDVPYPDDRFGWIGMDLSGLAWIVMGLNGLACIGVDLNATVYGHHFGWLGLEWHRRICMDWLASL